MNRLAITEVSIHDRRYIAYILLDEKRKFIDFQLFEREKSILDCIFIARVEKIVANIHAAFVSISDAQNCYLPLENFSDAIFAKKQSASKPLCEGDYLLVQVTKEATKTKDPVVSEKLCLHGKHSILTTGNKSFGISKKILPDKRAELEHVFEKIQQENDISDFGLLLRTNSQYVETEVLIQDIQNLIDEFFYLKTVQIHRSLHSCVYDNIPGYIQRIKATDLNEIDCIYTDCADLFDEMSVYLPEYDRQKLHFYNDNKISLHALYNVRGNLESLLSDKIWLASGANIIIEQLETITFIDVNTAKNGRQSSTIALEVNKEAAKEIARQLRLRNISGMIIVDFINMSSDTEEEQLIRTLKAEMAKDITSCQFIDITKLGLVEITRKKIYKSLRETLKRSL